MEACSEECTFQMRTITEYRSRQFANLLATLDIPVVGYSNARLHKMSRTNSINRIFQKPKSASTLRLKLFFVMSFSRLVFGRVFFLSAIESEAPTSFIAKVPS